MINLNDLTFDSIIRRVQDGDPEIQIGLVKDITLKNGTSLSDGGQKVGDRRVSLYNRPD